MTSSSLFLDQKLAEDLFPQQKCIRSLSSKASLKLKLGATFPHTTLALWLMCGHWGECELDGDQILQNPSMYFVIPIPPSKTMMLRKFSLHKFSLPHSLSLLANTQSTDVAIFVSHCDYMLTNHLHDYQHLCRCSTLMRYEHVGPSFLSFFSFFSVGNPAFVSRSMSFIFPSSHILTHRPNLTPSAIMSMSLN